MSTCNTKQSKFQVSGLDLQDKIHQLTAILHRYFQEQILLIDLAFSQQQHLLLRNCNSNTQQN